MKVNSSRFFWACCFMTVSALANAPQPPAEFWQYMLEFSDEEGAVIDPVDFAQLESLPEKDEAERIAKDAAVKEQQSISKNPSAPATEESRK